MDGAGVRGVFLEALNETTPHPHNNTSIHTYYTPGRYLENEENSKKLPKSANSHKQPIFH